MQNRFRLGKNAVKLQKDIRQQLAGLSRSIICFIVGVLFFKYKFLDLKFVILIVFHLTINTEWTVLEAFNQVHLNSTKNFALVRNRGTICFVIPCFGCFSLMRFIRTPKYGTAIRRKPVNWFNLLGKIVSSIPLL